MADLFYQVTVGVDEASTLSPLTSNIFLVELVCDVHADVIESDPEVAACDVARKVIKRYFSEWPEPGCLVADRCEEVTASSFSGWNTLDCGCRAVVTTNAAA